MKNRWICTSSSPGLMPIDDSEANQTFTNLNLATPDYSLMGPLPTPKKLARCYVQKGSLPLKGLRVPFDASHCNQTATVPKNTPCTTKGKLFQCGDVLYRCLPKNWDGICIISWAIPDASLIPGK